MPSIAHNSKIMSSSRIYPSAPVAGSSEINVTARRLASMRWGLLVGEIVAIVAVPALLEMPLPRLPMMAVVVLQIVANALLARRLRRADPFSDTELFVQLLMDVMALAVLMFLSGGAANPLISLLLPPVAIAALALPARLVAGIAAAAIVAYSLLMSIYLPLPVADAERATRLHLTGMWFTFVVSVVMMAWFVVRMTASIRQRDAELALVRERALRDERVIALGALAAGAAHELSTPLATMAIVTGELEADATLGSSAREDVELLRKQVTACKAIISGLAERAGAERLESAAAVRTDQWLNAVYARWHELRPHATSELHFGGTGAAPAIIADVTLEQGILNLLNNAADTGSTVCVTANWDRNSLTIEVRDGGPGFAPHVLAQAGRAPFPAHAGGSGVGLFLAHGAIARLGGELSLYNDSGGVAHIRLPAIDEA